jgi:hypothetical protein
MIVMFVRIRFLDETFLPNVNVKRANSNECETYAKFAGTFGLTYAFLTRIEATSFLGARNIGYALMIVNVPATSIQVSSE